MAVGRRMTYELTMVDRSSATMGRAAANIRRLNDESTRTGKAMDAFAQRSSGLASNLARAFGRQAAGLVRSFFYGMRMAIVGAGAAVAGFAGLAIQSLAQFDAKMRETTGLVAGGVASQTGSLQKGLKEAQKAYSQFSKDILSMAPGLRQTPTAMAGGLYEIVSAGITNRSRALNILGVATKGAAAGGSDPQTAARVLIQIMNSLGKTAGTTQQIMDKLFQTVNFGVGVTFPDLASSIGKWVGQAGMVYRNKPGGLEGIMASYIAGSQRGLTPANLGVGIANMLKSITNPSAKSQGAYEQYGIPFGSAGLQAASGGQGIVGYLDTLSARLKAAHLPANQLQTVIGRLFPDARGQRVASILLGNLSALHRALGQVNKSAGATDAAFKEQGKSIQAAIDQFKSLWEVVKIGAGQTLSGPFRTLLGGLTGYLNQVSGGTEGLNMERRYEARRGALLRTKGRLAYRSFTRDRFAQGLSQDQQSAFQAYQDFRGANTGEQVGRAFGIARSDVANWINDPKTRKMFSEKFQDLLTWTANQMSDFIQNSPDIYNAGKMLAIRFVAGIKDYLTSNISAGSAINALNPFSGGGSNASGFTKGGLPGMLVNAGVGYGLFSLLRQRGTLQAGKGRGALGNAGMMSALGLLGGMGTGGATLMGLAGGLFQPFRGVGKRGAGVGELLGGAGSAGADGMIGTVNLQAQTVYVNGGVVGGGGGGGRATAGGPAGPGPTTGGWRSTFPYTGGQGFGGTRDDFLMGQSGVVGTRWGNQRRGFYPESPYLASRQLGPGRFTLPTMLPQLGPGGGGGALVPYQGWQSSGFGMPLGGMGTYHPAPYSPYGYLPSAAGPSRNGPIVMPGGYGPRSPRNWYQGVSAYHYDPIGTAVAKARLNPYGGARAGGGPFNQLGAGTPYAGRALVPSGFWDQGLAGGTAGSISSAQQIRTAGSGIIDSYLLGPAGSTGGGMTTPTRYYQSATRGPGSIRTALQRMRGELSQVRVGIASAITSTTAGMGRATAAATTGLRAMSRGLATAGRFTGAVGSRVGGVGGRVGRGFGRVAGGAGNAAMAMFDPRYMIGGMAAQQALFGGQGGALGGFALSGGMYGLNKFVQNSFARDAEGAILGRVGGLGRLAGGAGLGLAGALAYQYAFPGQLGGKTADDSIHLANRSGAVAGLYSTGGHGVKDASGAFTGQWAGGKRKPGMATTATLQAINQQTHAGMTFLQILNEMGGLNPNRTADGKKFQQIAARAAYWASGDPVLMGYISNASQWFLPRWQRHQAQLTENRIKQSRATKNLANQKQAAFNQARADFMHDHPKAPLPWRLQDVRNFNQPTTYHPRHWTTGGPGTANTTPGTPGSMMQNFFNAPGMDPVWTLNQSASVADRRKWVSTHQKQFTQMVVDATKAFGVTPAQADQLVLYGKLPLDAVAKGYKQGIDQSKPKVHRTNQGFVQFLKKDFLAQILAAVGTPGSAVARGGGASNSPNRAGAATARAKVGAQGIGDSDMFPQDPSMGFKPTGKAAGAMAARMMGIQFGKGMRAKGIVGALGGAADVGGSALGGAAWLRAQVGKKYIWGGGHPGNPNLAGYDCSGLANSAMSVMGYKAGGTTYSLVNQIGPPTGPVVLGFNRRKNPSHMGISVMGQWYEARGKNWPILGPGQARSQWPLTGSPRFHGGGIARAPVHGGELHALLKDEEIVVRPNRVTGGMDGFRRIAGGAGVNITVEQMVVREEADIQRIAKELHALMKARTMNSTKVK